MHCECRSDTPSLSVLFLHKISLFVTSVPAVVEASVNLRPKYIMSDLRRLMPSGDFPYPLKMMNGSHWSALAMNRAFGVNIHRESGLSHGGDRECG